MLNKPEMQEIIKKIRAGFKQAKRKASFLIPVFGSLNPDSLHLAISSIQRQSYPEKEIIVVEEYLCRPKYKGVVESSKANYIAYGISHLGDSFSVARARNAGLAQAEGEFVIMHDADIVLQHRSFLDSLVSKLVADPAIFLATTPLRHLQKGEIKRWIDDFVETGDFDNYLNGCNTYEDWLISIYPYEENDFVVVSHPYDESKKDRRYVALRALYAQYRKTPRKWSGSEPLIFTPCVGKFFVATRREYFLAVGGYCERYVGWGGEDGDLKWKLSNFLNCRHLQFDEQSSQIHLDHDRPYFSKESYQRVKAISKKRQEQGLQKAVADDLSESMHLSEKIKTYTGEVNSGG